MGGSSFDLITEELFRQKRVLDQMKEENLALHRQITHLLNGHGILVEICGTRFALVGTLDSSTSRVVYALEPVMLDTIPDQTDAPEITNMPPTELHETAIAKNQETPPSEVDAQTLTHDAVEPMPTFLEELMLDEFTTATTQQHPVWVPTEQKPPAAKVDINDEEAKKAALRRELIGSFLLE